ncbi:ABC transporter ATP-binding protein [Oceanivirga miroungae]|uniref:Iron(III) ABC transporter, ATP-binding protein n=1 Tax=Oceanivirga miroungae TaxID=1130046 RepID=A0A6I8MFJ4_9FUSO|nr:ATP-binding cassette domain-containing protein [Oceanivirga miroungae]VWL85900.1 iron(III) ABC transporter, ATP-binding protein [Oceanivirga miroungae]
MYFEFNNVTFSYGNKKILDNFSFSLEKGGIILIKGESGIGKTTILKLISGILDMKKGSVILDGKDITKEKIEKKEVAYLFQDYSLFPHMTVEKNILYGLKIKDVNYWLELIGMLEYKKAYPNELSGGQKQRVALVRSLATNPKILLLDEPFSSIDNNMQNRLREDLMNLLKKLEITTIIVSHNKEDEKIADKIISI